MPLTIPTLDDRKYQELLDEALARIPVHNPEWTNFNRSDPGVTLIEVFAFLAENLLYRSNQIPERNRRKFLTLLGVPLQPAWSARGLVSFSNDRGPKETITLNKGVEVRAGQVPFRTQQGLDILPIEVQIFYKRPLLNPEQRLTDYYKQLYASFLGQRNLGTLTPKLYEVNPFPRRDGGSVDLGSDTVDRSLWIALLARPGEDVESVRQTIANKTLNLGVVPVIEDAQRRLTPGQRISAAGETLLQYKLPKLPPGGGLPPSAGLRSPEYRSLDALATADVLAEPGVVQITLPSAEELRLWNNLDPLEAGVGDLPPALDDTNAADRLITWLRLTASDSMQAGKLTSSAAVQAKLLWVGINSVFVSQRAEVNGELLPSGTGEPDQAAVLSKTPVLPGSVSIRVTTNGITEAWTAIDDLTAAGPEAPVVDLRQSPGTITKPNPLVKVFTLDAEAGEVHFGDGGRGARPPFGSVLRASYAYSMGPAGNVGTGAINNSPALPAGIKVSNPIPTWGGAAAETVAEGEKHIARHLQHRDRLVTAADFETITLRTPGVDIGRIEVLPAFNPALSPNEPGDAPGAVTLMLIPRYDPAQPEAPRPDRLFLDTVCAYLDPRRLVTTEVFLRGPVYKPIYVSAGIDVIAGVSVAEVREAVKAELLRFLSPLPDPQTSLLDAQTALLTAPQYVGERHRGWPLRKPVVAMELLAVASRAPGVRLVNKVLVVEGTKAPPSDGQIPMAGLELPRVLGISVAVGDPLSLDELRGQTGPIQPGGVFLPLPVIPEECR